MTRPRLYPLLFVLVLAAACQSSNVKQRVAPRFSVDEVPQAIADSEADLAQGRHAEALERLRSARNTPALPNDLGVQVSEALNRAADALINNSKNANELYRMTDVNIPRPLAVAAGIRAARLHQENGKRMKAFRVIRNLDAKFPQHPKREEAAQILFEVGESLALDKGRYALIFTHRSDAPQVLEYLVMNHPSSPHGDRSLELLADIYEGKKNRPLAIEKYQELLLWYPASERQTRVIDLDGKDTGEKDSLLIVAQARIPELRLENLGSPEYDRSELIRARDELQDWIETNHSSSSSVLSIKVQHLLIDVAQRLADSDLGIARFYLRVDSLEGARLHGLRALDFAREGGDQVQIDEVRGFLQGLEPEETTP